MNTSGCPSTTSTSSTDTTGGSSLSVMVMDTVFWSTVSTATPSTEVSVSDTVREGSSVSLSMELRDT